MAKGAAKKARAHVLAASPLLRLITMLAALLGAILLIGGLYLAFGGASADTKFNLFGNKFSSTSVGVSMAFIGAVLVVSTFRRVLRSVDQLAALHDEGDRSQRDSSTGIPPSWPEQKSLETLKRKLDSVSQMNAKILKAVAGADQYGIYADKLSELTGIPRDELVYRGKELQSEGLLSMFALTDLNFRLHEDVTKALGANPAQFIAAYFK
jgi:hypothetical protein